MWAGRLRWEMLTECGIACVDYGRVQESGWDMRDGRVVNVAKRMRIGAGAVGDSVKW
jgi:hypothetical protein